jgi:hypothetical protein
MDINVATVHSIRLSISTVTKNEVSQPKIEAYDRAEFETGNLASARHPNILVLAISSTQ